MTNEIQTAQATPSVAADGGRGDGDGKSVSSASTRKEEKFNFFKWVRGKKKREFLGNGKSDLVKSWQEFMQENTESPAARGRKFPQVGFSILQMRLKN